MNTICIYSLCGITSYLFGAVPFGYLIGRYRGIDIRRMGSGNIGATNVSRCAGRRWGILTFVLDALKGFIPAFIFPVAARNLLSLQNCQVLGVTCALLAVAGHNWPVYLGFRGGKGIATTSGALVGLAWQAMVVGSLFWAVAFLVTRYVSVASILAAVVVPVSGWLLYAEQGALIPLTLSLLGIIAIWRHKGNIMRLIKGTENRFEFRRKRNTESCNK